MGPDFGVCVVDEGAFARIEKKRARRFFVMGSLPGGFRRTRVCTRVWGSNMLKKHGFYKVLGFLHAPGCTRVCTRVWVHVGAASWLRALILAILSFCFCFLVFLMISVVSCSRVGSSWCFSFSQLFLHKLGFIRVISHVLVMSYGISVSLLGMFQASVGAGARLSGERR